MLSRCTAKILLFKFFQVLTHNYAYIKPFLSSSGDFPFWAKYVKLVIIWFEVLTMCLC